MPKTGRRSGAPSCKGQLADEQSFFADSKSEELAFWQDKLALTQAGSKEQLAVESNIYQLEKQLAVKTSATASPRSMPTRRSPKPPMPAKKRRSKNRSQLGKESGGEEVAQLKDLLDSEWALQQDYYEKKLAAAENDARTQEKLTEEEELAYQKYLTDKQKLDTQAVQDSQKQWESLLQPIQRALDTSITGIILGTTTVQKALSNLAQSIIAEFVNSAVKSVFGQLGKLLGSSLTGGGGGSGSAAIRISGAASPAPAKTSWAAVSPRACSARAVSWARSGSAAWFRAAAIFGSLFKRHRIAVRVRAWRHRAVGAGRLDGALDFAGDAARQ